MFDNRFKELVRALRSIHPEHHGILLQIFNDLRGPHEHVCADVYAAAISAIAKTMGGCVVQSDAVGEKVEIKRGAFGVLSSHARGFRYPRSNTPLIVAEHFVVDVSESAEMKISYIDPELQDELTGLIVPEYESGMLVLQDTVIPADDTHIMSDIGDVRLKTSFALLRFLIQNKCLANRRYVLYMDTVPTMLRAVSLSWQGGGWSISRRLVFRSDTCPVGTVVISLR